MKKSLFCGGTVADVAKTLALFVRVAPTSVQVLVETA